MSIAWKSSAKWALALVLLGYLGRLVIGQWRVLRQYTWNVQPGLLAVATLVAVLTFVFVVRIWHHLLERLGAHLSYRATFRIWFISALLRYVPGKIAGVMSMVYLCEKAGVSRTLCLSSGALNQAFSILSGLTVSALFLSLRPSDGLLQRGVLIGIGLVLIGLLSFPFILDRVLNPWLKRNGGTVISWRMDLRAVLSIYGSYLLTWVFWGVGFFFVVRSVTDLSVFHLPQMIAIFTVTYLAGFLAVLTPGGLGVREGLMAVWLAAYVPAPVAIVIGLLSRLWLTAAELICVAIAYGLNDRRLKQSAVTTALVLCLLSGWACPGPAQASDGGAVRRLNLEEVVQGALEQNAMLPIKRQAILAAKAQVKASKRLRLPDADFVFRFGYFNRPDFLGEIPATIDERRGFSYTAGLDMDSRLLDWGRNTRILRNSRNEVAVSELDVRAAQLDVIASAITLYHSVLFNTKILDSAENARTAATVHLEETKARFAAGRAPHAEFLRSQVSATNAMTNAINRKKSLTASLQELRQVLRLPPATPIGVIGELAYHPRRFVYDEVVSAAMDKNLRLQTLRLDQQNKERAVKVEQSGALPSLKAIALYTYQDFIGSFSHDAYTLGVNVDVPIFEGPVVRSQTSKARTELFKTKHELADLEESVRTQSGKLLEDLTDDQAIIESQESNIVLARDNVQITEAGYRKGTASSLEVANAREALTTAETGYYQAIFNYVTTVVQLAVLIGEDPRTLLAAAN